MTLSAKITLIRVAVAAAALSVIGGWAVAAGPAALTVFQAGGPIRASELNTNFSLLKALAAQGSERHQDLADAIILPQRLRRVSATQVSWPAGSNVVLDGELIVTPQDLTVTITSTGIGGMEGGSAVADRLYAVHAVRTGNGPVGLIGVADGVTPSGFDAYKRVGRFITGTAGAVVASYGEHSKGPLAIQSYSTGQAPRASGTLHTLPATITPGIWMVSLKLDIAQWDAADSVRRTNARIQGLPSGVTLLSGFSLYQGGFDVTTSLVFSGAGEPVILRVREGVTATINGQFNHDNSYNPPHSPMLSTFTMSFIKLADLDESPL